MHSHIRQFQVAATMVAVCVLLLWTPVVQAQAQGPGTLRGEDMEGTPFRASQRGNACSNVTDYSFHGDAGGPYPGTFFRKFGSFQIAAPSDPVNYPGFFYGDFHIDSTFGPIDGYQEIDNLSPDQLTCQFVPDPADPNGVWAYSGFFEIPYSATLTGTSCRWQGMARIDFFLILNFFATAPVRGYFQEVVETSNSCLPAIGPPAMVMLQPANAVNPVGTSHTVTATVTDANGHPVPNTTVVFTVTGADNTQGSCLTDQNGQCTFTYQGPQLPGADAIRGCVNSVTPSVCGDAAKEWVLPASTPGQVTGGGQIVMPPTDKVSFGFNAQSDGMTTKGNCNVIDHDKRIHIKCENVQALVVAGTHATFFGQADQDGVTTNYRIDVDDLADPGAGMDTFKIQTDQGYVAGGFLTAGNIKIHK
jgi:Bacterial Ig-like domain (group 1)